MTKNQIDITIRAFNLAKKELDALNKQLGNVEKTGKETSKGMGLLGKTIAGIGFAAAAKEAGQFIYESTMLSARVETLGVVTKTLGKNAGYTATEITALERAVQKQGITTQASRQSLALMMQAQLDLADSTDFARLAQDAAVIAGTNSSEAYKRLINVVTSGNVRMARTMGMQVDFNAGYEKMAIQLGKTTKELTAQEKAQSRANTVLNEGVQIAGTYEAAMKSVGKQVESTARYWEEYKVALGEANIEALGFINRTWQKWLKAQTEVINAKSLMHDAMDVGLMDQVEYDSLMQQAVHNIIDLGEETKHLVEELDAYNIAQERAIELDEFAHRNKQDLINITEELKSTTQKATEAELRKLQVEAFIAGDYALVTAIGEQIEALENEIFALDTLMATLDLLDGKEISYNVVAKGAGWVPDISEGKVPSGHKGGLQQGYASGGQLGNGISMVGEEGFELIIGKTVIPHEESKRLMRLGLAPGKKFGLGGAIDVEYPGHNWVTNTMDYGRTAADYILSNKFARSPYGGGPPVGNEGRIPTPGTSVPSGGISATSSAAQASSAAAAVTAQMTAQLSSDAALDRSIQTEMLEVLQGLAKAEDIEQAVKTAVSQAML